MPAQRCGTEGKTWHQGREGGNGDGNRDGGRNGNENEDRNGHEYRDRGEIGSGNGNENSEIDGGERSPGNLRSGNMSTPSRKVGGIP